MKFILDGDPQGDTSSLPVRGAWIEIKRPTAKTGGYKSLPVRGAWIEIYNKGDTAESSASLPVRGAWIEIREPTRVSLWNDVAPCEGSVD